MEKREALEVTGDEIKTIRHQIIMKKHENFIKIRINEGYG